LLEKGHQVTLLTGPTHGPEGKLLQAATLPPELDLVVEPSLVRNLHPLADIKAYFALRKYFRQEAFDVVHTHSSKAGVLGRLAAHKAGCPLVVHTVHGQAFHPYEKGWRNRLYISAERLAARRSHHIFAVAQAMIDQCVAAGVAPREKYSVVYSGMELEKFLKSRPDPELRSQLGIPEGVPVVGKIARLFELKGHEYLLAVAGAIAQEFPQVRFLLVGDGNLRSQLEREVQRLGLQDNFVFAGLVAPGEIPRYTALMDMLVHLSLREGLPRTVVQALATGIPAIGFALDGTPEVITHEKSGFVCPPQDTQAVRDAILTLLRDPERATQMGQAGQAFVREHFGWRTMVERLETGYLELVKS
jgi:glycosyltransferase involved in cell wall biosynthesis